MKKFLSHFKDILVGLLYLGLTAAFVLLIAGVMVYVKPQDLIGEAAFHPRTRTAEDMALGLRLLKLGGALGLGSMALLWVSKKIEAWLKKRKAKALAEEAAQA